MRVESADDGSDPYDQLQRRSEIVETDCLQGIRHTDGSGACLEPFAFFSRFRATLTFWLSVLTKNHVKKHKKDYRQFLTEIGPVVFKRSLLNYRNGITTG